MPSKKHYILEFNQYMKSNKIPYIIYADIVSLIKNLDGCVNNLENSSTTKISEHISGGYSMSKIWAFDHIENKHISNITYISFYRRKDCMKKFCKS